MIHSLNIFEGEWGVGEDPVPPGLRRRGPSRAPPHHQEFQTSSSWLQTQPKKRTKRKKKLGGQSKEVKVELKIKYKKTKSISK